MKKLNIGVLALSGIVFLNSCGATKTTATETKTETAKVAEQVKEEVKEEGINLSYMDKNVRP